eukprot:9502902-Pyramimonas_sp.AAC.1
MAAHGVSCDRGTQRKRSERHIECAKHAKCCEHAFICNVVRCSRSNMCLRGLGAPPFAMEEADAHEVRRVAEETGVQYAGVA